MSTSTLNILKLNAEKEFNSFIGYKNENLTDIINRFLLVSSTLKKYDEKLGNHEQVKKLLGSLPSQWNLQIKSLKQERNFPDYELMEVVNKLKSFDLDEKRREYNQFMTIPNVSPQNAALISSAANSLVDGAVFGGSSNHGSVKTVGGITSVGTTQIPCDTTALIAEIVEKPTLDNDYINCFDPFKEFYGKDYVIVEVIDDAEERKDCGMDAESEVSLFEDRQDSAAGMEEKIFVNIGNRAENAGTDAETVKESKLEVKAMIEQAKHDAVDEYKRNTPYCQCDRALEAEKLVVGLPYETVEDMCSSACKIRLIGIYKANRLLMTNENELKKTSRELKENESKNFVKLREALKENEHLKRSLLEKNCEINYLTEQVALAEFETRKVKNKLEQWSISSMKREDLCKKQRGARIKTGLGYKNDAQVYPPPSTFCYSPTPTPRSSNELIQEIIKNDTNSLISGLGDAEITDVREDYAYGGTSGLGSSGCPSFKSKKSVEDNTSINFVSSHVLYSDNCVCNSNLGCSTSNSNNLNDDLIEKVCGNDKADLSGHVSESQTKTNCFQKFFSRQIPSFTPVRISKPKDKESSLSSVSKLEPDK